jgi:hypothetical protein
VPGKSHFFSVCSPGERSGWASYDDPVSHSIAACPGPSAHRDAYGERYWTDNEEAIPKPLNARGIPLDDRHRTKKEQ